MNVEKAAEFLRSNHLPYWRVEKGGKNACKSIEAPEDEKGKQEIDLEQSIQFFLENMDLFEDGSYTLVARKNPKGNAGELRFPFKKGSLSTAAPAVNGFIGTVDAFKSEMQQTMNAKMEAIELKQKIEMLEFKHKLELEKKEKEIKEAKKTDNEIPLDKISAIFGHISTLIKQANGIPVPVPTPIQGTPIPIRHKEASQPTSTHVIEIATEEEQERLENAVNNIQEVIGDELLPAMENLARIAKNSPEQFKGYMQMLKN